MNVAQVLAGLSQGLALIETLAPVATLAGPQGVAAAAVVQSLGVYAETVLKAAQEANDVLTADDLASITAAAEALKTQNAALAQQIASS